MFRVKGKIVSLNDNKERELIVNNGNLYGNVMFMVEVRTLLEWLEGNKEPIGPGHYRPKGKYIEDEKAILLAALEVAEDTEVMGDYPVLEEPEEGVII